MTVNDIKVCEGLPQDGFPPSTSEGGRPVPVPAAGNGNGSNLNNTGSNGNYWSSTPNSDNSNNAWNLNFNSSNFNRNNNNRNNGQSVRPLRELASASAGGASHRLLEDLYRAYLAARRHKRGKGYLLRFEMNCRVIGNRDEWEKLPKDKSLFCSEVGCGLPIGNLSSQLFSNIYLGMLDEFAKRVLKICHYGRYVDDIVIVGESREEVTSYIRPIRDFLRDRLHLALSENKTRVCDARYGVEFLGAFIKPFRTYVSSRSLRRIHDHVHAVSPRMNAMRAQAVVNSSLGVLSHYASYNERRVLLDTCALPQLGRISEDALRFYPNNLDWMMYQHRRVN